MSGDHVDCADVSSRSADADETFDLKAPRTPEENWTTFLAMGICKVAVRIKFETPSRPWRALDGVQHYHLFQYALASCIGECCQPGDNCNMGDEVVVPLSPAQWVTLCGRCMRWCEAGRVGYNLSGFARSIL